MGARLSVDTVEFAPICERSDMHRLRSFVLVALAVFLICGFTACRKVHPAAESPDRPPAAPELRPIAVAANNAARFAEPAKNTKEDILSLHYEVSALETINHLKLTRSQLEQLRKLAATTAHKTTPVRAVKATQEFEKTLKDLRDALLDDNEGRVAALTLALDDLREKEEVPEFEDVALTTEARKRTPEVLRGLSARQLMGFLADFGEDFPDPRDKLEEAFDEIRDANGKDWEELRDETAGQVAWLIAGLDAAAEGKIRPRVVALLNRVHPMKDEEFTAKQEELLKQVDEIVGKVGPLDVIRHFAERSLAELLSNPRLAAAAEARMKKIED
jgi:hypothetical protein